MLAYHMLRTGVGYIIRRECVCLGVVGGLVRPSQCDSTVRCRCLMHFCWNCCHNEW